VALDPAVRLSPRSNLPGVSFLNLYYLGALSVGYFSGYFLLLFGADPDSPKRPPGFVRLLNWSVTSLVWGVFVIAGISFFHKNLPYIRSSNGNILRTYADSLVHTLPQKGAVVLSDDSSRLLVAEAAAVQLGNFKNYLFVHTPTLK